MRWALEVFLRDKIQLSEKKKKLAKTSEHRRVAVAARDLMHVM